MKTEANLLFFLKFRLFPAVLKKFINFLAIDGCSCYVLLLRRLIREQPKKKGPKMEQSSSSQVRLMLGDGENISGNRLCNDTITLDQHETTSWQCLTDSEQCNTIASHVGVK